MNLHRVFEWAACALLAVAALLLLCAPSAAAKGFSFGAALCIESLLPALFPFFVLCNLLARMPGSALVAAWLRPLCRFLGLRAKCAPLTLFLSWVGGYAVCLQCIRQYRENGQLSEREGVLLSLLGCCSGPGFVVGSIGGLMLHSLQAGVLLYFLQLAANFFAASCVWPFLHWRFCRACSPPKKLAARQPSGAALLPTAIVEAVLSSANVTGCVVFFRILQEVLLSFRSFPGAAGRFLGVLLEISSGVAQYGQLGGNAALHGVCFALSAMGLSVFCQLSLLANGCIPVWPLILSRAAHFCFLQLFCRAMIHLLPQAAPVYSSLAPRVVVMGRTGPDGMCVVFLLVCATLYKARKTAYNLTVTG